MKAIAIVGIAVLTFLLCFSHWQLWRANEAIKRSLAKCEADVMQWSKLAEYAQEFHAVPDETAEIDTFLAREDGAVYYSRKVDGGVWLINKSACGDSMGYFMPDEPPGDMAYENTQAGMDSTWPGSVRLEISHSEPIKELVRFNENFTTMTVNTQVGKRIYHMVDGRYVLQADTLQADTLRITNGKE